MNLIRILSKCFNLIFVALLVAGCASSPKAATPSPQVDAVAVVEVAGDASVTLSPSATPIQSPVSPTPTLINSPVVDLNEWDLLIISDSSNWGVGQYYAKLIEADMNVKVNLHDCWVGSLPVLRTLQALQSGETWSSFVGEKSCQKPLTDLVKEAEVMVLFGNPLGATRPSGLDACMAGGYQGKKQLPGFEEYKTNLTASCAPEMFATYKTNLGLVIDEIYKLREGRPLILRMTDLYIPVHADFEANDVDDACTACLSSFANAIRQVAAEHGVPVADTMAGFNGSDYQLDPVQAGYIGRDGIHLSDAGAKFIATLLQQTGYEYAVKP